MKNKNNVKNNKDIKHDNFPLLPHPNDKVNEVAYIIVSKDDICIAYQDLTGRFPAKSSRGNEYILIGYHYDTNCILGVAVKNIKIAEFAWA